MKTFVSQQAQHVSHQYSRPWWVGMAVYLKVVVHVHAESASSTRLITNTDYSVLLQNTNINKDYYSK